MPSIASIVLADGQTTPVNHTFAPKEIKDGVTFLEDRVSGVPAGYPTLSLSMKAGASGGEPITRHSVKLVLPTLDTTNPLAPIKAYDNSAFLDFACARRGSVQERTNLCAYLYNSLAPGGALRTAIINGEGFWL